MFEIIQDTLHQNSSSRKRKQSEAHSHHPPQPQTDYDTDGGPLTEDEMSVNVINRNKQKLLSHVLNPRLIKKEQKTYEEQDEEEEDVRSQ